MEETDPASICKQYGDKIGSTGVFSKLDTLIAHQPAWKHEGSVTYLYKLPFPILKWEVLNIFHLP